MKKYLIEMENAFNTITEENQNTDDSSSQKKFENAMKKAKEENRKLKEKVPIYMESLQETIAFLRENEQHGEDWSEVIKNFTDLSTDLSVLSA